MSWLPVVVLGVRTRSDVYRCRNAKCREHLDLDRMRGARAWRYCPSCRVAQRHGAKLALAVGLLVELLRWVVRH